MSASLDPLDGTLSSLNNNHNNHKFSTFDNDNDDWVGGSLSAKWERSGFWYSETITFLANGKYHAEGNHNLDGRRGMEQRSWGQDFLKINGADDQKKS